MKHKTHRHQVNHQLRQTVLSGQAARQLKHDMVESRVESDPWYTYNMGRLIQAFRAGRVVKHIYKNVGERLQRIAHHRAQETMQHGVSHAR